MWACVMYVCLGKKEKKKKEEVRGVRFGRRRGEGTRKEQCELKEGGMKGWMKRQPTRWHCCVVDLISPSSLYPRPLLPFLGLFLSHVVSSSTPLYSLSPSLYLPPLLSLSLTPSVYARHVWWSQLYSWELNTQNLRGSLNRSKVLEEPGKLIHGRCLFL